MICILSFTGNQRRSKYRVISNVMVAVIAALLLCVTDVVPHCANAGPLTVNEPTIFLFPENFNGSVYVFYDVPDAPPPKFEDGARVLDVPKNGWVITQLKRSHNPATQFYFLGKNGQRTPIRWEKSVHDRATAPDANDVLIRGGTRGSEGTAVENCVIDMLVFFVGTVDDLNKSLETINDPKKRALALTRDQRKTLSAQEEQKAIEAFILQHPPRCARPTPVLADTPKHSSSR